MVENEIRFLCTLAACAPAQGSIVEIGSFKGKSTVALATISERYNLGPIVAIDPHTGDLGAEATKHSPTFNEFRSSLQKAGVEKNVEWHRDYSSNVAKTWHRPIRLLWIDGDHSYQGCKTDFDLFSPCLADGGIVAFHDTLNTFEGPIRVFVENVLCSDRFGPCGFVHSIAWAQHRPTDGSGFRAPRAQLASRAAKLIPFLKDGAIPEGLRKIRYKFQRSRVPRQLISPAKFLQLLSSPTPT
jgi:hypothetical protein